MIALLVALFAGFGVVGSAAFNMILGACASLVATVHLIFVRQDSHLRRSSSGEMLTALALLATIYFGIGSWILFAGHDAPARGFTDAEPLRVFTVIASQDDPLRHEGLLEHHVGQGTDTAVIELSVVDDARVRRIDVDVVKAQGKHELAERQSPLRARVLLDDLQGGTVKLHVVVDVKKPVPETHPVNLLVYAEHGQQDLVWHVVEWFRHRYGP